MNNPVTNYAHCVDAGAALAHLELAAKEAGYNPAIVRYPLEPKFKSYIYQASIELIIIGRLKSLPILFT